MYEQSGLCSHIAMSSLHCVNNIRTVRVQIVTVCMELKTEERCKIFHCNVSEKTEFISTNFQDFLKEKS
jgi:hypothetical protein